MAIKITVTIDIGRKSYNCTRAGVCSITIGAELSLKPHQDLGIVEWEPGASVAKLHFRGHESLTEQGLAAILIDRAIHVPLPCTNNLDWFARKGRYPIERDTFGEYITLSLIPIQEK